MYRIDYELNGNRLYIDARDLLTLLVALPSTIDTLDVNTVILFKELVSALIATSEEIESPYLSISDENIVNIFEEIVKDKKAKEKSIEKQVKRNKK